MADHIFFNVATAERCEHVASEKGLPVVNEDLHFGGVYLPDGTSHRVEGMTSPVKMIALLHKLGLDDIARERVDSWKHTTDDPIKALGFFDNDLRIALYPDWVKES